MIGDNPRVLELRRRVQADPASIAFAQLAEECRRAGANEEAVAICRAGLQYHPDYLSARVTLARALIELGQLDEAETELTVVLKAAPENLAASRALAEINQKRGQLPEAGATYPKAGDLATVDETAATVEGLFDFDKLLEQLGGPDHDSLAFDMPASIPAARAPSGLDAVELRQDDADPFALLERKLRDDERAAYQPVPTEDELRERRLLSELEDWLSSIAVDRHTRLDR